MRPGIPFGDGTRYEASMAAIDMFLGYRELSGTYHNGTSCTWRRPC